MLRVSIGTQKVILLNIDCLLKNFSFNHICHQSDLFLFDFEMVLCKLVYVISIEY